MSLISSTSSCTASSSKHLLPLLSRTLSSTTTSPTTSDTTSNIIQIPHPYLSPPPTKAVVRLRVSVSSGKTAENTKEQLRDRNGGLGPPSNRRGGFYTTQTNGGVSSSGISDMAMTLAVMKAVESKFAETALAGTSSSSGTGTGTGTGTGSSEGDHSLGVGNKVIDFVQPRNKDTKEPLPYFFVTLLRPVALSSFKPLPGNQNSKSRRREEEETETEIDEEGSTTTTEKEKKLSIHNSGINLSLTIPTSFISHHSKPPGGPSLSKIESALSSSSSTPNSTDTTEIIVTISPRPPFTEYNPSSPNRQQRRSQKQQKLMKIPSKIRYLSEERQAQIQEIWAREDSEILDFLATQKWKGFFGGFEGLGNSYGLSNNVGSGVDGRNIGDGVRTDGGRKVGDGEVDGSALGSKEPTVVEAPGERLKSVGDYYKFRREVLKEDLVEESSLDEVIPTTTTPIETTSTESIATPKVSTATPLSPRLAQIAQRERDLVLRKKEQLRLKAEKAEEARIEAIAKAKAEKEQRAREEVEGKTAGKKEESWDVLGGIRKMWR